MRVGVVGAGWAAAEHCKTLATLDGIQVVGVVDADESRAASLAGLYGARTHPGTAALVAAEELDALVIATPPGAHREAAILAIEAGLAVFMEKPIARSVEDAAAIATAAAAAGVVCAVGYQWRAISVLGPLMEALSLDAPRHLVSEGIGVTQARSWFSDAAQSGGLIAERGSHHIDLQRRVGGEVVAVKAAGSATTIGATGLPPGVARDTETGLALTLHFASGALGTVHVLWVPEGYPSHHRLTVFGTSSVYELELDPAFALRRDSGPALHHDPAAHPPFVKDLVRFVDAARRRDPAGVYCSSGEAAGTLAVVVACEEALASGKTVPVRAVAGAAA
jgi:predicted dehydrogenase